MIVRYLWPLVQSQYPPPVTQPRLHNPLGLSQGLKHRTMTAVIAIPKLTQRFRVNPVEIGMFSMWKSMSDSVSLQMRWKINEHKRFSYQHLPQLISTAWETMNHRLLPRLIFVVIHIFSSLFGYCPLLADCCPALFFMSMLAFVLWTSMFEWSR